jgi:broad specificity phosphatase PhoE
MTEITDALTARRVWIVVRDQPSEDGILLGNMDVAIRPSSRQVYERLRRLLPESTGTVFHASPSRRAQQTASRLYPEVQWSRADSLGPRLYGAWQGLTWQEVRRRDAVRAESFWRDSGSPRPPDGESMDDIAERWSGFSTGLVNQTDWSQAVLMTHPEVARAAICSVLDLKLAHATRIHIEPLTVVGFSWSFLGWRLDELHTRTA